VRIFRSLLPFALLLALAIALPASAEAAAKPHYYLALGDSLSRGYQPGLGNTTAGYVDDVYKTLHAKEPSLKLEKLGCSGETTTTMIKGGICTYSAGSQLKAAEKFLKAHKSEISYVTLDIGANDVDGCVSGGTVNVTCVSKGLAAIKTNIRTILAGIRTADGGSVKSVGMTYYDPFLAAYLTSGGQQLAKLSVTLLHTFNSELTSAYGTHGFKTADVSAAFHSTDFTHTVTLPGVGTVPLNVGLICEYTYMCTKENIHPNPAGYQLIANTFLPVLVPVKK
jgi:lysophospholipase L1-like esterase